VVGIAPKSFFGLEVGNSPDIFVPVAMRDRLLPGQHMLAAQNNFWLTLVARIQPGASIGQAQSEAEILYHQAASESTQGLPADNPLVRYFQNMHVTLASGDKGVSRLQDEFGSPLRVLMAAVGLVLLIGCANIASLLLARASGRRREIGVRLASGAGRARLFRQFLTESLVLSTLGGAVGLLLGLWLADGLVGVLTKTTVDVSPDLRVLAFTLGISVLTGILFGTMPAFQAAYLSPVSALKNEVPIRGGGRRFGLKNMLVAGQVAVSLVLLIGAGLFIRTLANLKNLNLGFRPEHVLLASFNPELSGYSPERASEFYDRVLEQVRAMPGTQSASLADQPLLAGAMFDGLAVEGRAARPGESLAVAVKMVSPGFFDTMGIEIKNGRDFSAQDRKGSPKVAIINEKLARQFFEGKNPIGKHIGVGTITAELEIVGVIADTKYRSVRNAAPRTAYLPIDQTQVAPAARTLHVRTLADSSAMNLAIREKVQQIDGNLPIASMRMFSKLVDENLVQERLIASVSGLFGALAVTLACMGLYGVMAYTVARRTNEIGIRMALGARPADVLAMVLREGLLVVIIGVAAGVPIALLTTHVVQKLLFGINATDPVTIGAAAALMILVSSIAGFVPAWRAMRVDPMVALRHE
jgi:predicted permease